MTAKKKSVAKTKSAAVGRPAFASNLTPPRADPGPTMIAGPKAPKAGERTIALIRSTPVDVARLRTAAPAPKAKAARRTK